jgi:hypothetical protein
MTRMIVLVFDCGSVSCFFCSSVGAGIGVGDSGVCTGLGDGAAVSVLLAGLGKGPLIEGFVLEKEPPANEQRFFTLTVLSSTKITFAGASFSRTNPSMICPLLSNHIFGNFLL